MGEESGGPGPRYDAFISYSREDGPWVREHLYEPLTRCRTRDGDRPRIFLDVDREGVPPAVNFMVFLAEAIAQSRTVVAIYSRRYFSKPMCQWELSKVAELDPTGAKGMLTPVLIDRAVEGQIPLHVSGIHYIDVARDDWLDILISSLALTAPAEAEALSFLDRPGDVTAHNTLAPIRVAVTQGSDPLPARRTVEIRLEGGSLHGTRSVETSEGIATFDDLSIETAMEAARLTASAEGSLSVTSEAFAVRPAGSAGRGSATVVLPVGGRVVFFENDAAVGVVRPGRLDVFDAAGQPLVGLDLDSRPRLLARDGEYLAVASWSGTVDMVTSTGTHGQWSLAAGEGRYAVPGDLVLAEGRARVGLWSGRVFDLRMESDAREVLYEPAGVQRLAELDGRLVVCGLHGGLFFHQATGVGRSVQLERRIHVLKPLSEGLLALGETHLFRIPAQAGVALSVEVPLGAVVGALGEPDWPILIDRMGKGVVVDEALAVRGSFHAGAGAKLVGSDRKSEVCVLQNRDGSHSLVELGPLEGRSGRATRGRITFSRSEGTLAVSPSGRFYALGTDDETRILPAPEMSELTNEARDA